MREAGLSKRIVCAAAHTNYGRPSVYIRPSVAVGQLADDDMASRRAYQHFWLLNLASHTAMYQELWQRSEVSYCTYELFQVW